MLTNNQIRDIRSLDNKRNRSSSGLFIAEGKKLISELLISEIIIDTIYTIKECTSQFQYVKNDNSWQITEVSKNEIRKISQLKTPQGCLAICKIPETRLPDQPAQNNYVFCLDDIQDPGNLGTIVRLSDWFGMKDIICSPATADIFNPKVVQATMGAISRVNVHYTSLKQFLELQTKWSVPVFGTFLDGENIYGTSLPSNGIIVLGNEGKGISDDLVPLIKKRITIPNFHSGHQKPDSLNVSVAASIIISEFKRRLISGL
jgi:RNA methyltransferase, TrmH family